MSDLWKRHIRKITLVDRIREAIEVYRWAHLRYLEDKYLDDRKNYWETLHGYYHDLRAVGPSQQEEVNQKVYAQSRATISEFLDRNGFDLAGKKVLEIGIGAGFFTRLLAEKKPKILHGMDISQTAVQKVDNVLKQMNGINYKLWCADAVQGIPTQEKYDYIVMLDVTQHITNRSQLLSALKNIQNSLEPKGVYILTSYLTQPNGQTHEAFHVRYWPLNVYKEIFSDMGWRYTIYEKPFDMKELFAIAPKN
ncbi:MAG: class I SAM-dependent methyltransferase [Elusimicrobia bacterium]|nr:class I SAM-dependent methyltransferase [Elusimicrobiota bacterium]